MPAPHTGPAVAGWIASTTAQSTRFLLDRRGRRRDRSAGRQDADFSCKAEGHGGRVTRRPVIGRDRTVNSGSSSGRPHKERAPAVGRDAEHDRHRAPEQLFGSLTGREAGSAPASDPDDGITGTASRWSRAPSSGMCLATNCLVVRAETFLNADFPEEVLRLVDLRERLRADWRPAATLSRAN
jgi:hypothetical protein